MDFKITDINNIAWQKFQVHVDADDKGFSWRNYEENFEKGMEEFVFALRQYKYIERAQRQVGRYLQASVAEISMKFIKECMEGFTNEIEKVHPFFCIMNEMQLDGMPSEYYSEYRGNEGQSYAQFIFSTELLFPMTYEIEAGIDYFQNYVEPVLKVLHLEEAKVFYQKEYDKNVNAPEYNESNLKLIGELIDNIRFYLEAYVQCDENRQNINSLSAMNRFKSICSLQLQKKFENIYYGNTEGSSTLDYVVSMKQKGRDIIYTDELRKGLSREFFNYNQCYVVADFFQLMYLGMEQVFCCHLKIGICECCKNIFIKTRSNAKYCSYKVDGGKTCKNIGAQKKFASKSLNEMDKELRRLNANYRSLLRNAKKAGNTSTAEKLKCRYKDWTKEVNQKREEYLNGNMGIDAMRDFLNKRYKELFKSW